MTEVIQQRVRVALSPQQAYRYFTQNELLESFFTVKAEVEPRVGGKYELDWDPENTPEQSTVGCRITALAEGRLLAFDWKGPPPHATVMNEADPLTHVVVSFIPLGDVDPIGTEVHIVHSGWGSSEAWQEARAYFDRAWGLVLDALVELVGPPQEPAETSAFRA